MMNPVMTHIMAERADMAVDPVVTMPKAMVISTMGHGRGNG
jgi:hypothetical protein